MDRERYVLDKIKEMGLTPKSFSKIGKRCGLHLFPHILRHTCASVLMANGAALQDIQDILGHSDPKTTRVYAKTQISKLHGVHQQCSVA